MKICRITQTGNDGFTIVEMMISIAVLTILTAIALPSINQIFSRNDLAGVTNELIASINQARSEAVTRSTNVVICPTTGGGCDAGEWESGWLIFVDVNNNGTFNIGDQPISLGNGTTTDAISIDGFNNGLRFNATGILTNAVAANIELTHSSLPVFNRLAISNLGQIEFSQIHP